MAIGLQQVRLAVLPATRITVPRVLVMFADGPPNYNFEPAVCAVHACLCGGRVYRDT